MRPNRMMSLAVMGMALALAPVACNRGSTKRPEIPVTPPPRAMNEEMIEKPVSTRPAQPVTETAVAQGPTTEPVAVVESAKAQATTATKPVQVAQQEEEPPTTR